MPDLIELEKAKRGIVASAFCLSSNAKANGGKPDPEVLEDLELALGRYLLAADAILAESRALSATHAEAIAPTVSP